jgi:phosphate transport system protein
MAAHLQNELDRLKQRILAVSALVEDNLHLAVQAVSNRDATQVENIIETDRKIDQLEVDVEEDCLKILALHQPVAIDLRFIIAVLKMNNDLERIGDLAVNIAQQARQLARSAPVQIEFDLPGLATQVQTMLRHSLDAVVNLDTALARRVCEEDDEVDAGNREAAARVKAALRSQPENYDALMNLLLVSRHLERIADLATNIAEDAIYMVEGEIVRHWPDSDKE